MSDVKPIEHLVLETIKELKSDIKQLDSKFDSMHDVLVKNTVVLEEHERRSTASEERLSVVEEQVSEVKSRTDKVHGFLIYGGIALSAISTLVLTFKNFIVQLLQGIGK